MKGLIAAARSIHCWWRCGWRWNLMSLLLQPLAWLDVAMLH